MKVTGTVGVLVLFGAMMPVYAQRGEEGGKQEEKQASPAKPQQQHAQQLQQQRAQQEKPKQQPQQRAQQEKPKQEPQQRAQQEKPKQQPQQRAQQEKAKQEPQQRAPQEKAKQEPQQRAQRPAQTQQARQQPQRTEQQARSWQQQKGWAQKGAWQGHSTFQQSRSQNWSSDHRTWAQRGGYGGYIIPQDRFGLYFGSGHFFRLGGLPVMYLGYPRFSYGGFSFLMIDPWPGDWPENWYTADDVYVDYNDGYYLCNRRFPQERVAITIVL
jgi:hypothetical protein